MVHIKLYTHDKGKEKTYEMCRKQRTGGIIMANLVVISMEGKTKIYHSCRCRYVRNILPENKMKLTKDEARRQGYRICRCCNSMNYHVSFEKGVIDFYNRERDMTTKYIDGIMYVKTPISCWKIVYSRKKEQLALYHRNSSDKEIDFDHPEYEEYHRQQDFFYANSIQTYLNYIFEHDKFRAAQQSGQQNIVYSNKKYRKIAERSKRKKSLRKVYNLFAMLERQNEGYRELSFC